MDQRLAALIGAWILTFFGVLLLVLLLTDICWLAAPGIAVGVCLVMNGAAIFAALAIHQD